MRSLYLLPASLFCVALLAADSSWADSGTVKRGRTADGRAYRVDSTGLKMSDYIAELEVTVDDLKRQLIAAEDELAAKNAKSGAHASTGTVHETTIAGAVAPRQTALPPAAQVPSECERDAMGLRNEVQRLQAELAGRTTTKTVQPVAMKCDYNSPENPLWEQVNRLQNALMTGPTKESFIEGEKRRAELEAEVRSLRGELSAKSESVKESESTIAQLQERIESAEARVAKAAEETSAPARAALASPAPVLEATRPVAAVDPAAVRGASESFRTQLTHIQSLISERKNLLDASKAKKGVSVSIQPLVSRSGASLDSLRGEVARLSTASDLSAISAGLADIERVLKEDVGVLKRLSTLR